MTTKCKRCNKENHYLEICRTCERHVCRSCQKASKTARKNLRVVICKDCWGVMEKRKNWEQA